MYGHRTASSLTLALLTATFLTPPELARAAPGDRRGGEFQVNTFNYGRQVQSSVAMDADGDFVVVWTDYGGQEGYLGYYGIFAQRYNAAGVAQGSEFHVNTSTIWDQWFPAVAMDADGDFVVAWTDSYGFADVRAQRFDAAGVPHGPEFQVNTFRASFSEAPAVAMEADGDFVVAWTDEGQDGINSLGIFARRFDAAGVAQGPEFLVNSFTIGDQRWPAIAMDADGDFVVAWSDRGGQDGYEYGIFAQRFDAAGVAQGPEFQVNTFTLGWQTRPSVAMDADGDFVVAWTSYPNQDGSSRGVFAQRYDAAGVAQGSEFQVNTFTTGWQERPSVAMDADGDFIVAWHSNGQDDPSNVYDFGVYAQRYDRAGVALGSEFQVPSVTDWNQTSPAVALDADGDFVVAWQSFSPDITSFEVVAQRYQGTGPVAGDFTVDGRADILWRNADTGKAILWQMNGFAKEAAGSIGVPGTVWQVVGVGDFNADTKTDLLWRNTDTGAAAIWQMDGSTRSASAGIGAPPLVWRIVGTGDFDGDDHADILWRNSDTGAAVIWRMDGFSRTASGRIGTPPLAWKVAGVDDFDADAKSDILWRNTDTGATAIWKMDGFAMDGSASIGTPPLVWDLEGAGDSDGDRKADILWRRRPQGRHPVAQLEHRIQRRLEDGRLRPGGRGRDWQRARRLGGAVAPGRDGRAPAIGAACRPGGRR